MNINNLNISQSEPISSNIGSPAIISINLMSLK